MSGQEGQQPTAPSKNPSRPSLLLGRNTSGFQVRASRPGDSPFTVRLKTPHTILPIQYKLGTALAHPLV